MYTLLTSSPFILAPILSFIILIPTIALEVINRRQFNETFPFAVFTFVWVIQTLFLLLLLPVLNKIKAKKALRTHPVYMLIRIAGLLLLAYIWGGWIVDQWPCLVGVPNCD